MTQTETPTLLDLQIKRAELLDTMNTGTTHESMYAELGRLDFSIYKINRKLLAEVENDT